MPSGTGAFNTHHRTTVKHSITDSPIPLFMTDSNSRSNYKPPDFSIVEDDDNDTVSSTPKAFEAADISIVKESSPETSSTRSSSTASPFRRPPRIKKRRPPMENMVGTNWMQKNARFNGEEVADNNGDDVMMDDDMMDDPNDSTVDYYKKQTGEARARSFHQDFRGTRVFVQGIPPYSSWQDLKDHFQVAGSVVFASVSMDRDTGESKGHGIVQFENTDMAQHAIEVMRNHPLDGATLYVRPDVQESDNPLARLHTKMNGGKRGPTPPTKWKCANEENTDHLMEAELSEIRRLIKERDFARRNRRYEESDKIREDLKQVYGVFVDDRLKSWWTSVDGHQVPQSIQDQKGDGAWKLKPWRQIPTTMENDACVDPNLVEGLLKQRDIARREKDFRTADQLLEDARTAPDGDLNLRIHDESRTWRIWTEAPPPSRQDDYDNTDRRRPPRQSSFDSQEQRDPIAMRQKAAIECYTIVQEHAPEKIDEIKSVLKNFAGREYQVLKRLRKQYLS